MTNAKNLQVRSLIATFWIAALTTLFAITQSSMAAKRPNILFLFSDDQRADAVGYSGNSYVRTPNLDRMASSGIRFSNCFCMGAHHGAVCAPSRAMLMSGKYLHHVYDHLEGVQTLPMTLSENGYVTFGTGKWHNEKSAFAAGFSQGQSIFFGGMSNHFTIEVVDLLANGIYSEPEGRGFSTEVFADAAIEFLTGYAQGDQLAPFFAYVAFTVPHDPRTPPKEFMEMYEPSNMPLPPDFMPLHPFHNGWMTGRDEQLTAWPRTPQDIRSSIAAYYGLISHLDVQIGRIMDCLRRTGLQDNTIIVFTSDHGLAIGSHGLLGKQNLYEHSMKSPLFLMGPGIPINQQSDALVYLLDLYPTLLNLLGIKVPSGVDGLDLSPVIRGQLRDVRDTLFTAFEKGQRAVRDHRWKLIRYPEIHFTQLFDLISDPFELNNLAGNPEFDSKVAEMMDQLKRWQQKSGDPDPLTSDMQKSMIFDYTEVERKPDRHQPKSIIERYFPGSAGDY